MSNKSKNNTQNDLKEFEAILVSLKESGWLKSAFATKYEVVLCNYMEKMVGYSHRDQKPY